MNPSRALRWAWPALVIVRSVATQASANPMEKVIQLLDVLSKSIETEGKQAGEVFEDFTGFYWTERKKGDRIVKDSREKISQLQADLKEAEAFRDGKKNELVDLANKLADNEMELKIGKEAREKEQSLFETNEAVFIESIDQLDKALGVMAKKAPHAASASASLLTVAQRLQHTLTTGFDFSLSTRQHEILDKFVRQALASSEKASSDKFVRLALASSDKDTIKLPKAPSFLQSASQLQGPYDEYEGSSGGLMSTLEEMAVKVKAERENARAGAAKHGSEYQVWESNLLAMLENDKKSLEDIKSSIAQSQESSSQKQVSLVESQEIYKSEVEHVQRIENEFRIKTQDFKVRLTKHADEAIAIQEAQRILNFENTKTYVESQTSGASLQQRANSTNAAASFTQVLKEKTASRRKVLHGLKTAKSPGLTLLALKSIINIRHGADPFQKVKIMLRGMLRKLDEKQARDSDHAAWCDQEMGKTISSEKRKQRDVQKTKDLLEALDAELTQTKSDIVTFAKDLKEIQEAIVDARVIREKEHDQATKSLKQAKDASSSLSKGLKILKAYYEHKERSGSTVNKKAFKERDARRSIATGLISILEIAIADFRIFRGEAKHAEEAAARDFQETQQESQVRVAAFQKDLDWKKRIEVKLELDRTTMSNDLKSYGKELTAIDVYTAQLKTSCANRGPSYEEKKSSRAEELKSLRDALTYLKGR